MNRLLNAADMIIKGKAVADIGADHALLSIYLLENNLVPGVIIGELGDGPYQRAVRAVNDSKVSDWIDARQGDGLQVLQSGEVSSVIIAGMGATTIVEILSYDWEKSNSFERFVFQPMSKAEYLRKELAFRGWPIIEERLVKENDQLFVLIAAQPGDEAYAMDDLELEIGPYILKADNEYKAEFINLYLDKYRKIVSNLNKSTSAATKEVAANYTKKILRLEEMLNAGQS